MKAVASGDLLKVGLLGFGTVGQGVARILERNSAEIRGRLGRGLAIARALVRDISKPRGYQAGDFLTESFEDILDDPEIQIVAEVMGGVEPARTYILRAFGRGKHVVTANKELLAKHAPELFLEARKNRVMLRFEGSVAGGIPIIKPLQESLAGNRITELMGIINGTTNYILTKMSLEKREFADVLSEAQRQGYAESDPSSDIDGHDARYKLAILASLAFGTRVAPEMIFTEGIRRITPLDIEYADELGFTVKLLAIAREVDGCIECRVHPALVPHNHPLASVDGVFNAVFVKGNAVGSLMFFGRGAGDLPTGSAVVGDIMDIAKALIHGGVRECDLVWTGWNGKARIAGDEDFETRYYIHMQVIDRPGVLASIAGAFGEAEVSIESVIQKGRGGDPVGLVFVTHRVKERNLRRALASIRNLPVVLDILNVIRVEGEDLDI